MPRNVLIAVNTSEHCRRALDWYLEKLRIHGDQVLFAHVMESATIPSPTYAHGPTPSREEWDNIMTNLDVQARKITEPLEKRLEEFVAEKEGNEEKCEIQYKTIFAVGSAGEALCKMAQDNSVDMVIIGNRGMSSIRRTLLGSVSDYVIQHSHIAVVVVPPPKIH